MAIVNSASTRRRQKTTPRRNIARPAGLRLVRVWVPDLNARGFRAEAHRQSLGAASSSQAREDQAFVDLISDPE